MLHIFNIILNRVPRRGISRGNSYFSNISFRSFSDGPSIAFDTFGSKEESFWMKTEAVYGHPQLVACVDEVGVGANLGVLTAVCISVIPRKYWPILYGNKNVPTLPVHERVPVRDSKKMSDEDIWQSFNILSSLPEVCIGIAVVDRRTVDLLSNHFGNHLAHAQAVANCREIANYRLLSFGIPRSSFSFDNYTRSTGAAHFHSIYVDGVAAKNRLQKITSDERYSVDSGASLFLNDQLSVRKPEHILVNEIDTLFPLISPRMGYLEGGVASEFSTSESYYKFLRPLRDLSPLLSVPAPPSSLGELMRAVPKALTPKEVESLIDSVMSEEMSLLKFLDFSHVKGSSSFFHDESKTYDLLANPLVGPRLQKRIGKAAFLKYKPRLDDSAWAASAASVVSRSVQSYLLSPLRLSLPFGVGQGIHGAGLLSRLMTASGRLEAQHAHFTNLRICVDHRLYLTDQLSAPVPASETRSSLSNCSLRDIFAINHQILNGTSVVDSLLSHPSIHPMYARLSTGEPRISTDVLYDVLGLNGTHTDNSDRLQGHLSFTFGGTWGINAGPPGSLWSVITGKPYPPAFPLKTKLPSTHIMKPNTVIGSSTLDLKSPQLVDEKETPAEVYKPADSFRVDHRPRSGGETAAHHLENAIRENIPPIHVDMNDDLLSVGALLARVDLLPNAEFLRWSTSSSGEDKISDLTTRKYPHLPSEISELMERVVLHMSSNPPPDPKECLSILNEQERDIFRAAAARAFLTFSATPIVNSSPNSAVEIQGKSNPNVKALPVDLLPASVPYIIHRLTANVLILRYPGVFKIVHTNAFYGRRRFKPNVARLLAAVANHAAAIKVDSMTNSNNNIERKFVRSSRIEVRLPSIRSLSRAAASSVQRLRTRAAVALVAHDAVKEIYPDYGHGAPLVRQRTGLKFLRDSQKRKDIRGVTYLQTSRPTQTSVSLRNKGWRFRVLKKKLLEYRSRDDSLNNTFEYFFGAFFRASPIKIKQGKYPRRLQKSNKHWGSSILKDKCGANMWVVSRLTAFDILQDMDHYFPFIQMKGIPEHTSPYNPYRTSFGYMEEEALARNFSYVLYILTHPETLLKMNTLLRRYEIDADQRILNANKRRLVPVLASEKLRYLRAQALRSQRLHALRAHRPHATFRTSLPLSRSLSAPADSLIVSLRHSSHKVETFSQSLSTSDSDRNDCYLDGYPSESLAHPLYGLLERGNVSVEKNMKLKISGVQHSREFLSVKSDKSVDESLPLSVRFLPFLSGYEMVYSQTFASASVLMDFLCDFSVDPNLTSPWTFDRCNVGIPQNSVLLEPPSVSPYIHEDILERRKQLLNAARARSEELAAEVSRRSADREAAEILLRDSDGGALSELERLGQELVVAESAARVAMEESIIAARIPYRLPTDSKALLEDSAIRSRRSARLADAVTAANIEIREISVLLEGKVGQNILEGSLENSSVSNSMDIQQIQEELKEIDSKRIVLTVSMRSAEKKRSELYNLLHSSSPASIDDVEVSVEDLQAQLERNKTKMKASKGVFFASRASLTQLEQKLAATARDPTTVGTVRILNDQIMAVKSKLELLEKNLTKLALKASSLSREIALRTDDLSNFKTSSIKQRDWREEMRLKAVENQLAVLEESITGYNTGLERLAAKTAEKQAQLLKAETFIKKTKAEEVKMKKEREREVKLLQEQLSQAEIRRDAAVRAVELEREAIAASTPSIQGDSSNITSTETIEQESAELNLVVEQNAFLAARAISSARAASLAAAIRAEEMAAEAYSFALKSLEEFEKSNSLEPSTLSSNLDMKEHTSAAEASKIRNSIDASKKALILQKKTLKQEVTVKLKELRLCRRAIRSGNAEIRAAQRSEARAARAAAAASAVVASDRKNRRNSKGMSISIAVHSMTVLEKEEKDAAAVAAAAHASALARRIQELRESLAESAEFRAAESLVSDAKQAESVASMQLGLHERTIAGLQRKLTEAETARQAHLQLFQSQELSRQNINSQCYQFLNSLAFLIRNSLQPASIQFSPRIHNVLKAANAAWTCCRYHTSYEIYPMHDAASFVHALKHFLHVSYGSSSIYERFLPPLHPNSTSSYGFIWDLFNPPDNSINKDVGVLLFHRDLFRQWSFSIYSRPYMQVGLLLATTPVPLSAQFVLGHATKDLIDPVYLRTATPSESTSRYYRKARIPLNVNSKVWEKPSSLKSRSRIPRIKPPSTIASTITSTANIEASIATITI